MALELKILSENYLTKYKNSLLFDTEGAYNLWNKQPHTIDDFKFYLANAVVGCNPKRHPSNIDNPTENDIKTNAS